MASQVAKQVFASEVAAAEYAAATADRCCNLFMQSLGREEWLRDSVLRQTRGRPRRHLCTNGLRG